MPNNQPTVLVKKADGTFARMTLDEIKKMRSGGAPVIPTKPAGRVGGVAPVIPDRDPGSSRLDSRLRGNDNMRREDDNARNKPAVSQPRVNPVEEVLKKIRFKVADNLQNRLRSLIQLRLKDIRSADQTKSKAMQTAAEGGLGLGEKEAEELNSVCGIILGRETKNKNLDDVPVLKQKKQLPMVEPKELPATAAPFNAFVHGENKKRLDSPVLSRGNDSGNVFSAKPVAKAVMNDVQAPRPIEMGPIEEIQYVTLVDFRRLSAKPDEAAARLKQKLFNLRDESIMLYMEALAAWRKSPLYTDYMKVIAKAIKDRRKLTALASDAGQIKLDEMLAIVNMEKELE